MKKKSLDYLTAAKRTLGTETDYAFAKAVALRPASVRNYTLGRRVIDGYTAARIADVLQIDMLEVFATAELEREKDGKKREFWERKLRELSAKK